MNYGLYIHIPYCQSRCRYCDFYTCATAGGVPSAYLQALEGYFARLAPTDENGLVVRPNTVYFGGGTPSLLTPPQVEQLLKMANPAPGAEITLEANPESPTPQKLAGWRSAGVNRLSLGVQTANPESLKRLGRLHTPEAATAAFSHAHAAGFGNISADIMLALPGYTTAEFDATLSLIKNGGATHVSAYLLKIEEGTPFGKNPPHNLPTEDEAAAFYLHAVAQLQGAGYAQYEISNFAHPGAESCHNLLYWRMGEWLGLGPAAHSSLAGHRFSFALDAAGFIEGSLEETAEGPVESADFIMMGLRLAEGLDEAALAARFGQRLTPAQTALLAHLNKEGLSKKARLGWALTPRGMLVQNAILGKLLP